jgi:hypothetical protein
MLTAIYLLGPHPEALRLGSNTILSLFDVFLPLNDPS